MVSPKEVVWALATALVAASPLVGAHPVVAAYGTMNLLALGKVRKIKPTAPDEAIEEIAIQLVDFVLGRGE